MKGDGCVKECKNDFYRSRTFLGRQKALEPQILHHRGKIQGHPTRTVFFEFDILGTCTIATMDFDTSNFSKHVDI